MTSANDNRPLGPGLASYGARHLIETTALLCGSVWVAMELLGWALGIGGGW
jgi:hypothetical protein